MNTWLAIGRAIGSHTAILAPASIIIGVLFSPILEPLRPIIPTLFAVMTFHGALDIRVHDVAQVVRHPLSALAILATVHIVMPLLAYAVTLLLFPGNHDVLVGAVIEFSQPIAVMCFIWIGMVGGNVALALSVIVVSSAISPFTMPFTMSLLLGEVATVDFMSIMLDLLYMVAVPAVAGMLVNEFTHGWGSEKLAPLIFTPARVIFMLVIATNATSMVPYLSHMNWTTLGVAVYILIFCMGGFAVGTLVAWVLRRKMPDRLAIGYTCGMRNISVGTIIAATYFSGLTTFTVLIAVMYQQILAASYRKVLEHTLIKEA